MWETNDTFTLYLPYAFFALIPALILIFLLFRKRRGYSAGRTKNRPCPHCKALIEINESECPSCRRKVLFA